MAKKLEDIDGSNVGKITNNQINFIDVLAKRLNINVTKLLESENIESKNIYVIDHSHAVKVIRQLSTYQQNVDNIPENILDYTSEWK